jgi:peptidoglycan L-alanyl-D-glutamate endopeptidase CwlK
MLNAASERKLKGVKPDLVDVARRASEIGPPFQIVQGNRTVAEQAAIYAQGRSRPGKIVTWTKHSKHIGGNAVDFAALVNGKISWNDKLYPPIANAFKRAALELRTGIEWGGDWKTKDWGHIQLSQKAATPEAPTAGIGWTIADVQTALVAHGFDPGTIDGIMGPKTRAALKAFQKAEGLPETAAPDKGTTDALAKQPAPEAAARTSEPVPSVQGTPQWAISYLQELGWSREAAVALVANLVWESGGEHRAGRDKTINWAAHGDGEHSHGAGQWNDRHGRYQDLLHFAELRGTTWDDPATQLRFMDDELRGNEVATGKKLREARTVKEAADIALKYWRPGIPHEDRRIAIANQLSKENTDDA